MMSALSFNIGYGVGRGRPSRKYEVKIWRGRMSREM